MNNQTDPRRAVEAARAAVRRQANDPDAYRALARALRVAGEIDEAEQAEVAAVQLGLRRPGVVAAVKAFRTDRPREAERLIVEYLRTHPDDAGALVILGTIAERRCASGDAEDCYRRAAALAPAYLGAHIALATLLEGTGRHEDALLALDPALARQPTYPLALALRARILWQARRLDEAEAAHRAVLAAYPRDAAAWLNYGQLLKSLGRREECEAALRRAVRCDPTMGAAWWGLANLKSATLSAADAAAMEDALARAANDDAAINLHFALGKAHGDLEDIAVSFDHYRRGNALRRARTPHDAMLLHRNVKRVETLFTPSFLDRRDGSGNPAADPIFIVSLPRSGSTLVEQILASHPAIEGVGELYALEQVATDIGGGRTNGAYLDHLAHLDAGELRAAGDAYLAKTRALRRTGRPFFTDKMPGNWALVGLIRLILPNARIIDVRRHPMACGFANFTQHFSRGADFSYDLGDIGRYYRDYARQMAHFDRVAPGTVHRVLHDDLVDDLEREVRRLLAYLRLPFDPACLRFHENTRAVFTPSADQVRRPVNRDGMERWRAYDFWLAPLREALGHLVSEYR